MRPLPYDLLVHCDWSKLPKGRWRATAWRDGDGWRIEAAAPADAGTLIDGMIAMAGGGAALLGVDLPIGVPRAWAARAGVTRFMSSLSEFGRGRWSEFYDVARTCAEISLTRPFYPDTGGGKSQAHLVEKLGLTKASDLARRCDADAAGKKAASHLFWTLGPAQVGKAALSFWKDVLQPAHEVGQAAVWPYDGDLETCCRRGRVAVAETYPREIYGWLGLTIGKRGFRKGDLAARIAAADALLAHGLCRNAAFAPTAREQIIAGFPVGRDDAFDAMVGLLGLLEVVEGGRPAGAPDDDDAVRRVEGWILGRVAGGAA